MEHIVPNITKILFKKKSKHNTTLHNLNFTVNVNTFKMCSMEYTVQQVVSLISHIHTSSQEFTKQRLADKGNFASSHGYILYLLSTKESLTMGELSKIINRDKSTTTVLVKKLKDEGLVKEEINKEDSRSKKISLTAEGKKMNKLTSAISRDLLEVCYKDFSESEKETLLQLLQKMSDNVDAKI